MEPANNTRNTKVLGLLFVACMFLGMGGGLLAGHLQAGLFAGMGVGFLAIVVLKRMDS